MERKLIIETGGELHMPQKAESTGEGRWTASVWKLDKKNLNGRTYSTALAQRLVKEDARTLAYDGHEAQYASGGEYAIAKAVCSHPRIEDGELRVDIDFVDEAYERMLQSLMAKGIAIGVSSVGYGCEDEDGHIEEESYELVRYLDFVTCPAGEVYARMESERRGAGGADGAAARATAVAERHKLARSLSRIMRK